MAALEGKLLNGVEGYVTVIINGEVHRVAELTKISAEVEKVNTEYKTLGERATQNKPNGFKGSGTMTLRYGTDYFKQMMLEYVKTGKNTLCDIIAVNNDPNFEGGEKKTRLGGVNITKITVALLDVDAEILNEEIPFVFTEVDIL